MKMQGKSQLARPAVLMHWIVGILRMGRVRVSVLKYLGILMCHLEYLDVAVISTHHAHLEHLIQN